MPDTADVVICGAGIAGIAAAHELAVKHAVERVVLVDERPPLSLTSDKSTECYRNWWPGPDAAMVSLMNRSIDLLEGLARESDNAFRMNRRGYLYATADPARIAVFRGAAELAAAQGAGPVRSDGYLPAATDGADVISDPATIRALFPYLAPETVAVVHARRAGWFSGHELGMLLLERARAARVELRAARVTGVDVTGGRVSGVRLSDGGAIATHTFVDAAGPLLAPVGRMIGVELPVFSERHAKIAFDDHLGVVPRIAPLLIWADPQVLAWSAEERAVLAESAETRPLLERLAPGAHTRPEGGRDSTCVLMLWAHDARPVEEVWPPAFDPMFPEVVLRGLATMLPGLRAYVDRMPRPQMDGGYYTKTRENRPLIGPLPPVEGAFVIGALSGYGLMAAPAAGELLAAHITGGDLPAYAPALAPARYGDPAYRARLATWDDTGQL